MYMLTPHSYFRVVGILPSGRVTGRFYTSIAKFSARLTLDFVTGKWFQHLAVNG
jgi:hypothetical protein